jgi:hypothetical protein
MQAKLFGFVTLGLCLALLIALPTAQAQTNAFGERDPFWKTDASSNLPVTLCHIPPGNSENAHTIEVGQAAVPAHLAHGDTLGECAGECPPYPSPVAATGQSGCWDQDGNPVDCAGTGQNGELQIGVAVDPRFTDNGDGTVTDNLTGLVWVQNVRCFDWKTWTGALIFANSLADPACNLTDGSVAGDWRVPNINELRSLIDYGERTPPIPSGSPFPEPWTTFYWSSTTVAGSPSAAWGELMKHNIHVSALSKDLYYAMWPVRGPE